MVIARHQTLSYHNNSYHWAFHFGVKSRLNRDPSLEYEKPQSRIRDMDMVKLLPGKTTMDVLRSSFPHLVARIITKFISAYSTFKSSVTYHIVHKNSKQMAEKSHQVCMLFFFFIFFRIKCKRLCFSLKKTLIAGLYFFRGVKVKLRTTGRLGLAAYACKPTKN